MNGIIDDPLTMLFTELKEFMGRATTVQEWNSLRVLAKVKYPTRLINKLDASGFIVSLNLKNENDYGNK